MAGHFGGASIGQAYQELWRQIKLTQTLVEQTQQKLQGQKSIADRIVSFHDPQARPIRKGKLNKAVEFGRTLQLVQDSSGIILHYEIHQGNPSDRSELLSLVHSAKRALGIKPTALSTDRGYYSKENVSALSRAGIKRVGIPKVGRLSPREKRHQQSRWFRQLQRFRCGIEASISMLKRKFGLGRVLARGSTATAVGPDWVSSLTTSGSKHDRRYVEGTMLNKSQPLARTLRARDSLKTVLFQ